MAVLPLPYRGRVLAHLLVACLPVLKLVLFGAVPHSVTPGTRACVVLLPAHRARMGDIFGIVVPFPIIGVGVVDIRVVGVVVVVVILAFLFSSSLTGRAHKTPTEALKVLLVQLVSVSIASVHDHVPRFGVLPY